MHTHSVAVVYSHPTPTEVGVNKDEDAATYQMTAVASATTGNLSETTEVNNSILR